MKQTTKDMALLLLFDLIETVCSDCDNRDCENCEIFQGFELIKKDLIG